MSPEQATGGKVDARSDVFSFGSVLYEMLTGQRAFAGASRKEMLSAVVSEEPKPLSAIAPGVPAELEKLIQRCLRKDPERRFQHISDVKVQLQELREESDSGPSSLPVRSRRGWLVWSALAGLALALGAGGWLAWRSRAALPEPKLLPVTTMAGNESYASFSPDATQVAFCWEGEGRPQGVEPSKDIWVKFVTGMETRRLTSSPEDDWTPSWSPDGSRIAFVRLPPGAGDSAGGVFVVSSLGGGERRLGDFPAAFSQLSWSPDSRFVAARRMRGSGETAPAVSGIYLVPIDGGEPRALTTPVQPGWDKHPAFSPDGRALAYAACAGLVTPPCDIYLLELDAALRPSRPPRRLTRHSGPIHGLAWTRDGRSIVYARSSMLFEGRGMGSSLWRVRTDGREPELRIESIPPGAYAPATTAARDRLLFVHDRSDVDFYRFSASGPPEPVIASSSVDYGPRISPDGRRIAFESWRAGTAYKEIWLADIDGSNATQLTHVADDRESPAVGTGAPYWSPDGKYVVHNREEPSQGPGAMQSVADQRRRRLGPAPDERLGPLRHGCLVARRALHLLPVSPAGRDGLLQDSRKGGEPERVTQNGAIAAELSWDGKQLLYSRREGRGPLFVLNLEGGQERQLTECGHSRSFAASPGALYYIGCPEGEGSPLYRVDTRPASRSGSAMLTNVSLGLTVSPDGRTIIYARDNLAGADLMMVENFR